ncbi:uncharacterized protein BJX67DRAFT_181445 [Aspergillus lucknowensis]|uniref:Uncharacterized protein n=1 Tax=Aspergillus lucknowensis TaxID=176173 RepID=A0ABR4LM52_9EURO
MQSVQPWNLGTLETGFDYPKRFAASAGEKGEERWRNGIAVGVALHLVMGIIGLSGAHRHKHQAFRLRDRQSQGTSHAGGR